MEETQEINLSTDEGIVLYVDAGTKNNGQRGKQQTVIVVCDRFGTILVEKWIGDFTTGHFLTKEAIAL